MTQTMFGHVSVAERKQVLSDPERTDTERKQIFAAAVSPGSGPPAPEAAQTFDSELAAAQAIDSDRARARAEDQADADAAAKAAAPLARGAARRVRPPAPGPSTPESNPDGDPAV
jgi:hypothetical protein